MASQNEHDRTYMPVFLLGVFLVVLNIYWFAYDFFFELGARSDITDQILVGLQRARMFDSQYTLKIFILIFLFFTYSSPMRSRAARQSKRPGRNCCIS